MAEPLGHISSISTKSFKFFLFVKSIFLYTVINDNPVNEISVYKDGPSNEESRHDWICSDTLLTWVHNR